MEKLGDSLYLRNVGGILYVTHLPSIRFFVSGAYMMQDFFVVEPLTVSRFVRAVAANLFLLNYWRVLRILVWRFNAFELKDGDKITWSRFRPYLWLRRTARRAR